MPKVHKIKTDEDFNKSIVPEGFVLQFVSTNDNGDPVIRIKKSDNTFTDISGSATTSSDYTAWEVYVTQQEKEAGSISVDTPEGNTITNPVAVKAAATETFNVYSNAPQAECDVIVDWGDGTVQAVAAGQYHEMVDNKGSITFTYKHTYSNEGRYIVKVFGKNYWKISHLVAGENLTSRVFAYDLPIATHLNNLAQFCKYSDRLLYVRIDSYSKVLHASNLTELFHSAANLVEARGFSRIFSPYSVQGMFSTCEQLVFTDFVFPVNATTMHAVFFKCSKLVRNIEDFFLKEGSDFVPFSSPVVFFAAVFLNCQGITGTVPADILWNSPYNRFDIDNTSATNLPFKWCNGTIQAQVPASWGGSASDDVIIDSEQAIVDKVIAQLRAEGVIQ